MHLLIILQQSIGPKDGLLNSINKASEKTGPFTNFNLPDRETCPYSNTLTQARQNFKSPPPRIIEESSGLKESYSKKPPERYDSKASKFDVLSSSKVIPAADIGQPFAKNSLVCFNMK